MFVTLLVNSQEGHEN